MIEIDNIANQILQNCCICDSRHAGLFSICGLALRLRDLYKWENRLDPWIEKDSSEILEWIGNKEEEWERVESEDFVDITILGNRYGPFDASGINEVLEPQGLFYGAGYVHSLKPTFFLASLEDKMEIDGFPVYILGREVARDLLTLPALSQDGSIFIRKESARLFLWNQTFFLKKSGREALSFALENCGVNGQGSDELRQNLARIAENEIGTYIYHELGGIRDPIFDRQIWREIIATFPHTPIELLARTVKDLLADTNEYGTLRYITRKRKTASLGFYVAFLDGLRKELSLDLIQAFGRFTRTRDWQVIEQAVTSCFKTAEYYADAICSIYQSGKEKNDTKWTEREMKKRLLAPLGINRG
ncbi:MAG: hypothetical protein HQ561_03420 [Desulfobacteraceae bacterium]|nr:hypothetical protein [Desulfobacteraceae bacterium]